MAKHQRKLRNFLLNPHFQLKYALYFASVGILVMGLMFSLITNRLNNVLQTVLADAQSANLAEPISMMIYDVSWYALSAFFANVVFSVLFAIWATHRVAGPAYVIENYIRDLKEGNYDSNRELRKDDDLKPILAGLKELAAILKDKK